MYTGADTVASADLINKINALAANSNVNGTVIDLGTYPDIVSAYAQWDADQDNPQSANYVARSIKSLLYSLLPAYPDLKYIVIVGGDQVIPQRRIVDRTLVSNERTYPYPDNPALKSAFEFRYYLSDDYYAASLPIGVDGREVYIPQYGLGRLVEKPSEIATMIDTFTAAPVLAPHNALVTGYDFLKDQATEVSSTLTGQGIPSNSITSLINDNWTAQDFSNAAFNAQSYDLISLNSHFDHFSLFPNDPTEVMATEFDRTNFIGKIIFSVGCHSGLNVFDNGTLLPFTGADFAQMFARHGSTFIGNTGFGYGDGDLLAYSERLMLNFTEGLGYNPVPGQLSTMQTVGSSFMQAKQRYLNSLGNGGLTTYDEKVVAELTLYGLPMLKVNMPTQTSVKPGGESYFSGNPSSIGLPSGTKAWSQNLNFTYTPHTISDPIRSGTYYTVNGGTDLQSTGNRPMLPLTSVNFSSATNIVRGVLMEGGSFTDTVNDPVIAQFISQQADLPQEGIYLAQTLYPQSPASVNRFLTVGGTSQQRLIVVPAQFQTTSVTAPTTGILRKYNNLNLVVYTAPYTETDFTAPNVWSVQAAINNGNINFSVDESDDQAGGIYRTVVLYRDMTVNSWTSVDLTYDPATGLASGSFPAPAGSVEYFVQAVDQAGNVSLVLDHGLPFRILSATADFDGDGVVDSIDNSLLVPNSNQADFDHDGIGDASDINADNDPIVDVFDAFPFNSNEWLDLNHNGVGDNADPAPDADNDTVIDGSDNCPFVYNPDQLDSNHNGIGDACDPNPPVNHAPVLNPIANQTVAEQSQLTFTATATDVDMNNTLNFNLIGAPAGASINPTSGVFTWAPTQPQAGKTYTFYACVNDGSLINCKPITTTVNAVTVSDTIAPAITASATLANGAPYIAGTWTNQNVTVHFTCSDNTNGSGIPASACPADQILSAEGAAVSSLAQTVTDAAGNTSIASNVITVKIDKTPPATNAGGSYIGSEGASITLSAASVVDALNQGSVSVAWSVNSALCSFSNATTINPTLTCSDNGNFTVTLKANDGINPEVSSTAVITVNNVAPTLGAITIITYLVPVNTAINASATFTEPGSLDTHTAQWNWDDATPLSGGNISPARGNGIASASHSYSLPGVYVPKLTVIDNSGAASNQSIFEFVVVYDPTAGFATGSGSINALGAYLANPTATYSGKLGFNTKYKKDGKLESETEFELTGVKFHFHSNNAQWLVVNGAKAEFQGTGTVEGSSHHYGFTVTVVDGQSTGGGGIDKVRLSIWDMDNGNAMVYDTQAGASLYANPTTSLIKGNLKIKK
jgi:hypothetical protein